ncbi:hypothetical protein [Fangia hongkongensis]|uniref:hypothetical protein n=2 Tax=Fangia hongkongensis TaxID=270495 RepID=UPI0012B5059B|nr:hypothetical protein [Fangia hongkongensis]
MSNNMKWLIACVFLLGSCIVYAESSAPVEENTDAALLEKSKAQLQELEKINQEIAKLSESLKKFDKDKTVAPKNNKSETKHYSALDKQAMNSPIFVAGGAPRSPNKSRYQSSRSNQNNDQNKDNPYKNKDDKQDKTDDKSSTDSSSTSTNPYNNNLNNYGGYYPYSSSSTFKMKFGAASYSYSYQMSKTSQTEVNPFANVASNNITLTLTNTSTSYYSISFCSSDYNSCGSQNTLSSNAVTIKSADTVINGTYGGYKSYTFTPTSGSESNYWQGVIYAKLYSSSSDTTPTQIQVSFPVSNCSVDSSDSNLAACSLSTATYSNISTVS